MNLAEQSAELIVWLDHSRWKDNQTWYAVDGIDLTPCVVKTYGVVVEDKPDAAHIVVASTITAGATKCNHLQCIVRGAILRRTKLIEAST